MRAKVTERGVVIPKKLLRAVQEVEIRRGGKILLVVPRTGKDAIYKLGSSPVSCGAPDASENLDKYLY